MRGALWWGPLLSLGQKTDSCQKNNSHKTSAWLNLIADPSVPIALQLLVKVVFLHGLEVRVVW